MDRAYSVMVGKKTRSTCYAELWIDFYRQKKKIWEQYVGPQKFYEEQVRLPLLRCPILYWKREILGKVKIRQAFE